jgi:hypothetical protein
LNTRITTLQTDLNKIIAAQVTATETQALSAGALQDFVDGVKADVVDLQEDLTALLANSNVVNGNLIINDAASLKVAKDFGTKVSIITGNLTVNVSTLSAAEVNEVSSLFKVVFGDVKIVSNKTLDVSNLVSVGGVLNANIEGNYEFSSLVSVIGAVTITDYAKTLLVDFEKLVTAASFKTSAQAANTVLFAKATSVKLNAGAIVNVSANDAMVLQLWAANNATTSGLTISATEPGSVITIAGDILGADADARPILVSGSATSVLNAAAVTKATTLNVTAQTVDFTKLASAAGDVLLTSTTAVAFPALTTVGAGHITAATAVSFIAPKLVATGLLTLTAATTVSLASSDIANLPAGVIENLTFSALNVAYTTPSLTLKTVNVTGKAATAAGAFTCVSIALETATFGGQLVSVSIAQGGTSGDKLTALTTTGKINSFTLYNADVITSVSLGHTHIAGLAGSTLDITNNDKLASLTTSTDFLKELKVTGNALLTSANFASYTSVVSTGPITIEISGNKLTGDFDAAVAATGTTAYVEAKITSAALATLKPFVTAFDAVPSAAGAPTLALVNLNLSNVSKTATAQTLTAAMTANAGVSTVIDATNGINTVAEFLLIQ